MARSALLLLGLSVLSLGACRHQAQSAAATPAQVRAGDVAPPPPEVAREVLANMDRGADPCGDFYRYACGGWMDATELPDDEPRFGRFNALRERNKEALRSILERAKDAAGAPTELGRLGTYYRSCMDEAAVEARGLEPLRPLLAKIDAVRDQATLMRVAGVLHRAHIGALFDIDVGPDYKRPEVNLAHLSQGGLGLPDRDYYFPKDDAGAQLLANYGEHVRTMLELVGEREPKAAADGIVAFETELARAAVPRDQLRDPVKRYHRVDLARLRELTPTLPWEVYFAATGHPGMDDLNLTPAGYFGQLADALDKTDPATLRSYLRWQVLRAFAQHLPSAFARADFEFYKRALRGQKSEAPRWKRCVDSTDRALGESLGRRYVETSFAGDSRDIALSMIKQIEAAFADGLPRLSWMDDTTRQRAIEKMNAVVNKIGYPDKWRDYGQLSVGDDYLQNVLYARRFDFDRRAREVGKAVDPGEWHMTPPTVNAYYNPSFNEMVFPAGILQPPFFHPEYPMAMNFGGIGMVMGHELTHGFDDQGRKFDGDGKMRQWWEPRVAQRFEARAQCVEELYGGYEVQPGLTLNGKLTLGENIADLGGIKDAYRAYAAWAKRAGVDTGAPVMDDLTQAQLFFVAYGQIWCAKATPQIERVLALTDPHSHSRYRVNGPLSQLPEFWATFACEEGTDMHPQNACEVW